MPCTRCQYENPSESNFCNRCGTRLTRESRSPTFSAAPESYTPAHLAERILRSKAALEGERKLITVLFADLKGSMELLADRDPEQARDLLDPVLELMMDAVHRYEGTVNQVMGDGIMALFGAPIAHEDHAVRACYAALAMQQAVRRHAERLRETHGAAIRMRIGLNSGEVVVRSIGSDLRMDYSAVGQATHLAARMEQLAPPGSIMMTASTAALAEGFVDVTDVGPTEVKGLAAPVAIYELRGTTGIRSRLQAVATRRGLSAFVGRQHELSALRDAAVWADRGAGQVVAVVGEPGVGKSRLLWEFLQSPERQGWNVFRVGAASYEQSMAFLPVRDLLRDYFGLLPSDDVRRRSEKILSTLGTGIERRDRTIAPLLALLDVPVDDDHWHGLDPLQKRELTLDTITGMLVRDSATRPLVLIVEDLHWIDAETEALLDALVDRLANSRVLLVITYRPEYRHDWSGKSSYRKIPLDPLTVPLVEELLGTLVGVDSRLDSLKAELIRRTEGNPFLLEESVQTLVETGILAGTRGAYRATIALGEASAALPLPPTAQAMLAARIDRLDADDKRVLQAAAVIGKEFPYRLLETVADVPDADLRRRLLRLEEADFVYEVQTFPELQLTFKHALTHEVAYSGVLLERRRHLHGALVESIERLDAATLHDQVGELARHAVLAERWDKAVDYSRAAGARAWARGSLSEAVTCGERALERSDRLGDTPENTARRIDARLDLHAPLFAAGQIPRLIDLHDDAERMARETGDRRRLGAVAFRLAAYFSNMAQYATGLRYANEALDIATHFDDRDLRLVALYMLSQNESWLGNHGAVVRHCEQVVDGRDAERARSRLGMAIAPYVMSCTNLARSLAFLGEFDRALTYVERARVAADEAEHPAAQVLAGLARAEVLLQRADYAEALVVAERAVSATEENRLMMWLPATYVARGRALVGVGAIVDGLTLLEQGIAMREGLGVKAGESTFLTALAEGHLIAAHFDNAKRVAETALAAAVAARERTQEAHALCVSAEATSSGSDPAYDTALELFARARAISADTGLRPLLARCELGRSRALRGLGNHAAAHDAAAVALAGFREMGMPTLVEKTREEFPLQAWR